jgi:hypothetical protein
MATTSVPKSQQIKIEKETHIGLQGLVQILMRRTHKDGTDLGELSDVELVTVLNQATNVTTGYLNGLHFLGDLVSSHDPTINAIDTNSLGWLIRELTEGAELMRDVEGSAESELQRRGYDSMGIPLSISGARPE